MNLKLNEIIWEITSKCNKGCKYCGSKDILNSKIEDYEKTIKIAEMIAKYPPESINLSGGEPGCMDSKILAQCIDILIDTGIEVKIITNGEILKKDYDFEANIDYNKVSLIGLSINTLEDIEYAKKNFGVYLTPVTLKNKIVVITNFGKHNIWDFDKIAEFVKDYSSGWQVQLTEGNDLNLPTDGIQQLWNKLENCDTPYTMADNLQYVHECTAGIKSCGITFDGYVMPCLSMRSWANEKQIWDNKDDYNLFNYNNDTEHCNPLRQIWETQFRYRRFCDNCKCCRSFFEYPVNPKVTTISIETNKYYPNPLSPYPKTPNTPIVMMYGITQSPYYEIGDPKDYTITTSKTDDTKFVYGVSFPDENI